MVTLPAVAMAALIGVVLGTLGAGGSILMVPAFVYAAGLDPKQAIAASLPVVAVTSVVGAVVHWRNGNVLVRAAVAFGLLAMTGAYLGARLGTLLSPSLQLTVLAIVTVASALSMLRPRHSANVPVEAGRRDGLRQPLFSGLLAMATGVLTGVVGIGGGFLFVPVLVLLAGVPVRQAIGTSLVVIAMNAAAGFLGYAPTVSVPWELVLVFAGLASAGALAGVRLSRRTAPLVLQRSFAVVLFMVAGVLLFDNFPWWGGGVTR